MQTQHPYSPENIHSDMQQISKQAKAAYQQLAQADNSTKNTALLSAAAAIRAQASTILTANAVDIKAAQDRGTKGAFLDRLTLNDARIEAMAKGLEDIATLPDPVGRVLAEWQRPNGLSIARITVPLGVIGIIYESRPNVTADAAGLCLKSGNAAILRSGSESFYSAMAIMQCLQAGLKQAGLPETSAQLVPTQNREAVGEMLRMAEYIDIIVPRGGKSLIERVVRESRIPTIQHLDGNCHSYIHQRADIQKACDIVRNAKMRRTGVCGATESLLIDTSIAANALPAIVDTLHQAGCEIRGDATAQAIDSRIIPANETDWSTEYLDAVISVKTVTGVEEAIAHINQYGSHHTDAIITEDAQAAQAFLNGVDSAIVMHNASTQFADGGEFGMGAEIGISTGRLHARGPVGCEQLTTYKYAVRGQGQTRP